MERGYDPRDFTLIPYGGAGPLHAVALAKELKIPKVLVPPIPGILSAMGMLISDIRHEKLDSLQPGGGLQQPFAGNLLASLVNHAETRFAGVDVDLHLNQRRLFTVGPNGGGSFVRDGHQSRI